MTDKEQALVCIKAAYTAAYAAWEAVGGQHGEPLKRYGNAWNDLTCASPRLVPWATPHRMNPFSLRVSAG